VESAVAVAMVVAALVRQQRPCVWAWRYHLLSWFRNGNRVARILAVRVAQRFDRKGIQGLFGLIRVHAERACVDSKIFIV